MVLRLAGGEPEVQRDAGLVAGEVQGIDAAGVDDLDVCRAGVENVVVVAGAALELDPACTPEYAIVRPPATSVVLLSVKVSATFVPRTTSTSAGEPLPGVKVTPSGSMKAPP